MRLKPKTEETKEAWGGGGEGKRANKTDSEMDAAGWPLGTCFYWWCLICHSLRPIHATQPMLLNESK